MFMYSADDAVHLVRERRHQIPLQNYCICTRLHGLISHKDSNIQKLLRNFRFLSSYHMCHYISLFNPSQQSELMNIWNQYFLACQPAAVADPRSIRSTVFHYFDSTFVCTTKRRKTNKLRRNCLLKHATEEKIQGMGQRERRRNHLLDNLQEKREYCKLKEEALDRTLWRTSFGKGYGRVVGELRDERMSE